MTELFHIGGRMAGKSERRAFIDLLAPLGLPVRFIAQATGSSEASIKMDLYKAGGIGDLFPNRPTNPEDVYVKTLQYFFVHNEDDWESRPERQAVEDYLGMGEIRVFLQGMCTSYNMLKQHSLQGEQGEMRLMADLLNVTWPLPDQNVEVQAREWMRSCLAQCAKQEVWPTSVEDLKRHLAEYVRTTVDRKELRSASHGDVSELVERAISSFLDPRKAYIVRHYYGIGCKADVYRVIGEEMGLSKERVRTLRNEALEYLREQERLPELGETFANLPDLQEENLWLFREVDRAHRFQTEVTKILGDGHWLLREYAEPVKIGSEYLTQRLDELELSTRAQNCFRRSRIEYIYQVVERTEEDFLQIKNFGRKCLNEIKEILADMGLRLGMHITTSERLAIEKILKDKA